MAYNSSHTGKEIDNAVDQLDNVSDNVELIKNTVNNHSATIQTHSDKFITIQNSVNNLIIDTNTIDRKVLKLEKEIDLKASTEFVNQINEKVSSLATTDTISNIQSQIIVLNDEINELNGEKANQTELNEVRSIANGAISSLSTLSNNVSNHGLTISTHTTKLNNLETQITNLGIDMGNLSTADGRLQTAIDSNKAEINRTIQEINEAIGKIQGEIASIKSSVDNLSISFEEEKQLNSERGAKIDQLIKTTEEQSATIIKLQEDIESLKQQQTQPTI